MSSRFYSHSPTLPHKIFNSSTERLLWLISFHRFIYSISTNQGPTMCQALSRWLDTRVNKPDGGPWPWNFHFQWWEARTEWTDSEEYRVREIWHLGKNLPFPTSLPPYCYTSPEEIARKKMLSNVYIILPFTIFMCMVTATCTSGDSDGFQLWFKSSDLLHNCMFKSSQIREEFVKNVKDHHRKKNSTICLSNPANSSVTPTAG